MLWHLLNSGKVEPIQNYGNENHKKVSFIYFHCNTYFNYLFKGKIQTIEPRDSFVTPTLTDVIKQPTDRRLPVPLIIPTDRLFPNELLIICS